jgi:hypothetical protein
MACFWIKKRKALHARRPLLRHRQSTFILRGRWCNIQFLILANIWEFSATFIVSDPLWGAATISNLCFVAYFDRDSCPKNNWIHFTGRLGVWQLDVWEEILKKSLNGTRIGTRTDQQFHSSPYLRNLDLSFDVLLVCFVLMTPFLTNIFCKFVTHLPCVREVSYLWARQKGVGVEEWLHSDLRSCEM